MSYGVEIGTAIVSYIEPHPGHAVDFNRWYERDHFPATVTGGPGVFSGARFVATRACKAMRPPGGRLFGDPGRGSYLAVAWVLAGKQGEWDAWVAREMETISAQGRLFPHRDHVHTAVYRFVDGSPGAITALDRGYGGVLAVVLAPNQTGAVRSDHDVVTLRLERTILSEAEPPAHDLVLIFCDDPAAVYGAAGAAFAGCAFASPFLATVPGTDTYADDL